MHIPGNKEDVVYLFRASQEKIPDACASGIFGDPYGNLPRPEKCPPDTFPPGDAGVGLSIPTRFIQDKKSRCVCIGIFCLGDPYGNRTHVTAVKGRCLNRLTNGPGSGNLTRTDDIPGMNRLLYQLSYAAKAGHQISFRRNQLRYYIRAAEKSQVLF